MNIMKKSSSIGFIAGLLLSLGSGNAAAALNLSQTPLFLADQIASNVMVMLDNSGSMKIRMYSGNYDNAAVYSGIFDNTKNYVYDADVPVNSAAYPTMVDASSITMIDTNATGAFVESACSLAVGNTTCWNGNFLNWLTTRRIDASRDVLVGGKLESRSAFNYSTGTHAGLTTAFKKVANNERSDGSITASSASSSSYSPVPDGQTISVDSPAENGDFKTAYDPYAKISSQVNAPIYDSSTNIIGEFSTITLDEAYKPITLNRSYVNPVVIAKAPTFNGSDPSIVRIKNVTANGFEIRIKEWDHIANQNHANESLSFIVVEEGEHELVGGLKLKAGITNTDQEYVDGDCGSSRTNSTPVSFSSAFPSTPIVVSSVMTDNDTAAINSRVWNITTGGFTLALQEEESPGTSGHSIETIGYIAIEPGTVDDTAHEFKLEAGTKSNVNNAASTITYSSSFSSAPAFVAAMQTKNDNDTAAIRLDANSTTSATLHVEEERSCTSPNEVTHANEDVGYFALQGKGTSYNLAVMATSEPTGILHDVKDKVRLGISFYRFDPNKNDLYNGVTTQGGTLRFKIPKNPFVRKPSDTGTLPAAQQGFRELEGYIGTSITDIVDAVEHYPLIWGTTPIAENLYEVIQYFEQDTPHYPDMVTGFPDFVRAVDATSPARPELDPYYIPAYSQRLHCVNSSVLIVTDGEPYRDADIPAALVDYDEDPVAKAGDVNSTDPNDQGQDNLDDVAYWAFCDKSGGSCFNSATPRKATVKDAGGVLRTNLRDLRPDGTWTDMIGDQYLKIDTIGFAGNSIRPILQDTADNAGGTAYPASDGAELKTSLLKAFENAAVNTSASSVAANSTRLDTNTLIYQASFDSGRWAGQLQALGLQSNGDINATPTWHTDSAGTIAAYATRKVFTYKPPVTPGATPSGTGITFLTQTDLNTTQQTQLTQAQIDYLRGDDSGEVRNGGSLRDRTIVTINPLTGATLGTSHTRVLGDIINSNPWFVGADNFGYTTLPSTEGSTYAAYVTAKSSKPKVVYVGANDGMLHAFDAGTGVEKFAYVPATVIPDLAKLADANYGESLAHQYFVDGSPRAGDVYFGSAWHTVLVGTTGAGGKGVFALDVSDADNFDETKVLWEFNSDNSSDMGSTLSEPTVVRMANDKWAAIVGNGYNSATGKAMLFILDIEDGSVIRKIDTGVGNTTTMQNGLSSHIPVDTNGDHIVDAIYAGDLLGNMWKFDVTGSNTAQWDSAIKSSGNPAPLFTATDASSNPQAITAKPQVGRHPDGGVMVYFGTGKYFETGDNVIGGSPQVHTYYGLHDDDYSSNSGTPITARSQLQAQTIDAEASALGFDLRITSSNTVNYPTKKGWYMELQSPVNGAEGERVISASVLRGERIIFTTLLPNSNPCESGGSSWLMELDGISGARLGEIAFDLTNDGLFTEADLVKILDTDGDGDVDADDDNLIASGKKSQVGIIKTPTIITTGDKEFKYASGTSGGLEKTTESSGENLGRQSWRQLR